MTSAIWMALGGLLGAFVRCFADQGIDASLIPPRIGPTTVKHAAAGFFTGGILGYLFLSLPAATLDQYMTGAGALAATANSPVPAMFLGGLVAYCGIDLTWLVRRRLPSWLFGATPEPPPPSIPTANSSFGGLGSGPLKLNAILLAVSVATSGCSIFGKPADDVNFNRGQFSIVVIRLAEMHGSLVTIGTLACQMPNMNPNVTVLCGLLDKAEAKYQDLKPQIEKAITDPRTVPDWVAITRGLEILAGTVALVATAVGAPALIPALAGGIGGVLAIPKAK